MSENTTSHAPHATQPWWHALRIDAPGHSLRHEAHQLLQEYQPASFTRTNPDSLNPETLTWGEMLARIAAVETESIERESQAQAARLAAEQADFDSAWLHADSAQRITEGSWAGFTRGEARAWIFSLFQFETRGIAHPGSELRFRSLAAARTGETPDVFGYPERARKLADRGLTPHQYRELRALLRTN